MRKWTPRLALMGFGLGSLTACGDGAGSPGRVEFTVYGEAFVEEGIPSSEFADGWAVTFEKFLIVVGDVRVANSGKGSKRLAGTQLYDLTTPGPHPVGALDLAPGAWADVGYATPVVSAATETHGSISAEDRALMESGPYGIYVAGSAEKGTEQLSFAWGFREGVVYSGCISVDGGVERPGFSVPSGGRVGVELTIHGDHFFYDDLASDAVALRFQAIADADDGDGDVTLEELSSVELVDLTEGPYGTGGASDVDDLGAFVRAQTRTLGHFRGEGHCIAE